MPVAADPAAFLAAIERVLTDRTRLVAVSHVTTETGTLLPVAELTRRAHAAGSLACLDGAHGLGQVPLDLHAVGRDVYAMVGYKWAFGPSPSAALYIWRAALDQTADAPPLGPDLIAGARAMPGYYPPDRPVL